MKPYPYGSFIKTWLWILWEVYLPKMSHFIVHLLCPTFFEMKSFTLLNFDVIFGFDFSPLTKIRNPTLLLPHIFEVIGFAPMISDVIFRFNFSPFTKVCNPTLLLLHMFWGDELCSLEFWCNVLVWFSPCTKICNPTLLLLSRCVLNACVNIM